MDFKIRRPKTEFALEQVKDVTYAIGTIFDAKDGSGISHLTITTQKLSSIDFVKRDGKVVAEEDGHIAFKFISPEEGDGEIIEGMELISSISQIDGNTYPFRKILHSLGFTWSPSGKVWKK